MMMRNMFGAILALLGAAAAVLSPFANWYGNQAGRDVHVTELFAPSGLTSPTAALFAGLFLPMLVVAALTVAGVLLRSRLLVAIAGLAALGFTILWMVRQYQVADTLVIGSGGLGWGVVLGLGSGALLLVASAAMGGRGIAARGRHAAAAGAGGAGAGAAGTAAHHRHRHGKEQDHEHHHHHRREDEGDEPEGSVVDGPWGDKRRGSWRDTRSHGDDERRDAA